MCMSLNVCLCVVSHNLICSQRVHSPFSLEAHLLSPLPPQLHAAVKVIIHDAQKDSPHFFTERHTCHTGSRVGTVRQSIGHSSIRLHSWSTVFHKEKHMLGKSTVGSDNHGMNLVSSSWQCPTFVRFITKLQTLYEEENVLNSTKKLM